MTKTNDGDHKPDSRPGPGVVMEQVANELKRANELFGPFRCDHEGLGVLREEYLEFEQAVFHGTPRQQAEEALQLAAMAIKHLVCRSTVMDLEVAVGRLIYKFEKKLQVKVNQEAEK